MSFCAEDNRKFRFLCWGKGDERPCYPLQLMLCMMFEKKTNGTVNINFYFAKVKLQIHPNFIALLWWYSGTEQNKRKKERKINLLFVSLESACYSLHSPHATCDKKGALHSNSQHKSVLFTSAPATINLEHAENWKMASSFRLFKLCFASLEGKTLCKNSFDLCSWIIFVWLLAAIATTKETYVFVKQHAPLWKEHPLFQISFRVHWPTSSFQFGVRGRVGFSQGIWRRFSFFFNLNRASWKLL